MESNIQVPFTAPAFNAAAIAMASTSAFAQVSGKQNKPGRSLRVFDLDFSPDYKQVKSTDTCRTEISKKTRLSFLDYLQLRGPGVNIFPCSRETADVFLAHSFYPP